MNNYHNKGILVQPGGTRIAEIRLATDPHRHSSSGNRHGITKKMKFTCPDMSLSGVTLVMNNYHNKGIGT